MEILVIFENLYHLKTFFYGGFAQIYKRALNKTKIQIFFVLLCLFFKVYNLYYSTGNFWTLATFFYLSLDKKSIYKSFR